MEPITVGILIVALVPIIFGRTRASSWLVSSVKSGSMTRRTAIWLIAMLTIAPYAVLSLWIVARSPGFWWLGLILFIVSWPLIAVPMIVLIHETAEPKSK